MPDIARPTHDLSHTHAPSSLAEPKVAMRFEGLAKQFGALSAVDNVSFEIPEGSVLGIGGPNGAGKTTLFDLISGVQRPTSGRFWIGKSEATNWRLDELCHSGVARTFQLDAAFDTMTALENVRVATYFGTKRRLSPGLVFESESRRQAWAALERVGLSGKAHKKVCDMPVLERKLVMLAGALAMKPRILLMDEPVGGLTPSEIEIFEDILSTVLVGSVTLVVIEHVMSFLLKLSHRLLIMHQGRVIFDGAKDEMLADNQVVEVYLGQDAARTLRAKFGGEEALP
jgi:branched-chain amino acid transport system ATP-binding protein